MLARDKCAKFVANSKPLLTFFTLDVAVNRYALTDDFLSLVLPHQVSMKHIFLPYRSYFLDATARCTLHA